MQAEYGAAEGQELEESAELPPKPEDPPPPEAEGEAEAEAEE